MLQNGQVIGVLGGVVQQPLHERRMDGRILLLQRPFDGFLLLQARHAWDQVVAIVQRFRQPAKLGALSEEVGSHGQQDVHGDLALVHRVQQEVDEERRRVAAVLCDGAGAEAEEFLELVHHQQEALAGLKRLPRVIHQIERRRRPICMRIQRCRERPQRRVARSHGANSETRGQVLGNPHP